MTVIQRTIYIAGLAGLVVLSGVYAAVIGGGVGAVTWLIGVVAVGVGVRVFG